jgi:hypothetical protein
MVNAEADRHGIEVSAANGSASASACRKINCGNRFVAASTIAGEKSAPSAFAPAAAAASAMRPLPHATSRSFDPGRAPTASRSGLANRRVMVSNESE